MFLLAGEEHVCQPVIKLVLEDLLPVPSERTSWFKESADVRYLYKNKSDKPYFQHGSAYGKYLAKKPESHKVLRDDTLGVTNDASVHGHERVFKVNSNFLENNEAASEPCKPVVTKYKGITIITIDYIWGATLAEMQLLNTFSKNFCWTLPLEEKK